MKILITGAAGFIGFSFAKYLLEKDYKIIGLDNLNDYYDVNLKKKRLKQLSKSNNFKFYKVDLTEKIKIEKIFKNNKIDFIFHFAAQAGVRHSIDHPRKYIESNILGFYNLIENVKNHNIKRLFYASSSSVYGDSKTFPLNEKDKLYPRNIYAVSKVSNEKLAKIYGNKFKLNLIGLRFFTVYGEWGRPDMLLFKILKSYKKNKTFYLNNKGDHFRDFTYIKDVISILYNLIFIKKFKHIEAKNDYRINAQ